MNGKAVFPGGNVQSLDNIAGQPIAEYTHSKSGTVHKLEGPEKAKHIVFKATGDYNDGDTWTLNNKPVTVTYNGGEELLPTTVLAKDTVQAVLDGNHLWLMLQKPKPQDSILKNGDWRHGIINQRGQKSYGTGYGIDMWYGYGTGNITLEDDGIVIKNTGDTQFQIEQFFEDQDAFDGNTYTLSVLVNGKIYTLTATIDLSLSLFEKYIYPITHFGILFYKGQSNKFFVCLQCRDGISAKASAVKLEPGNRFTGWPAWDYGAELSKCQRYFCKIDQVANGFITGSRTSMRLSAITPVTMRTKPALTDFKVINVRTTSGSSITPDITGTSIEALTQCGATITVDSQTFNTEPYVNNTPISARIEGFLDANL